MKPTRPPGIVCLSNVYDENYHRARGEDIERCIGVVKRRDLFQCLAAATGREVIVLSSPPKPKDRRKPRWLPAVETKFSNHRQFFCANWDAPKLRIPLAWFFYARQVLRHTRSGDLVLIDNYEFIYIVAARVLQLFRRVTFILDYEDGKHAIERSWTRVLGWLAETGGRGLIRGAFLATPALGERLPDSVPKETVPGFVPDQPPPKPGATDGPIRLLYSGGLNDERGIDLLLESLPHLPENGWRLDITGHGPLAEPVARFANEPRWRDKVTFHGALPPDDFNRLLAGCHAGLNCQRSSTPISEVTFPSKVFTYLAAGLLVISSRASGVEQVCGAACLYYAEETPASLAAALKTVIENFSAVRQKLDVSAVFERYTPEATTLRVKRLLLAAGFEK
jgi:glycosyltransferase involved in cell wall biosynthesis